MIYESAVARYIETAKYSGEFASDEHLARLVIDLAAPRLGEKIYDPCFGLGGFLSEAARRVVSSSESLPPAGWREVQERSVFGVEINPSAWLVALGRVILAGVRWPNLELGNTLERPMPRDRSAEGFDVIVANLPFGGKEPLSIGEHFRIKTATSESLFLQHTLGNLRLGGRAVVVVPQSVLFRHGADEQIRRQMLEEFHVDAVISLPAGWLEGTTAKAGILCVSRREPAKEVVFVGEQLWDEGLEPHPEKGNRRGILLDAIHYRQGLVPRLSSTQQRHLDRAAEHIDRAVTHAFFQDAFDEFNPETGYVTSSGNSEEFRDVLEKLDLARLLPSHEPPATHQNLKRLPQLHGVRTAWTVPVAVLARRHWELVAKETGEGAVEDLLQRIQRQTRGLKRVLLADIADLFSGVGYDKDSVIDTEPKKGDNAGRNVLRESIAQRIEVIGKVPLVRVQDVTREKRDQDISAVIRRPAMYLNEKGMERVRERHRLRVGDILLTASGTVGSLALVHEGLAGAVPAKSLIVIRSHGAFSSLALLRLLQSAPYQEWITGSASGSVIRHLSVRVMRQLPLADFTQEQQRRLAQQLTGASDADAVLEGFSSLSGESIWISFLLNDLGVSALLEAGQGRTYADDWWSTLRTVVDRIQQLHLNESDADDRDSFRESLLIWLGRAVSLMDVMELPVGMERYAAIQSWTRGDEDRFFPDLVHGSSLAGRATARFQSLYEVLFEAADKQCDRIAESAALSIHVENPLLDAGRPGEIELLLSNPGVAPIRKLHLKASPLGAELTVALLSSGATVRWACPMPARAAGEFPINVDWTGHLLNDKPCQGALEIAVAYRSLRLAAARSIGGNPYVAGHAVWQEGVFYGREDVLGRIYRLLHPDSPPTVILLEGNRRAGKTSVLRRLQVPGELPDWVAVYVSFQGVEGDAVRAGFTAQNLFRELTNGVLQAVALHSPHNAPELLKAMFSASERLERKKQIEEIVDSIDPDRPFERFRDVLEASLEAIRPKRMLLMLDEFDKIQEAIDNHVLSPNVPENIRYLFHQYEALSGILTGSRRIKRLREEYLECPFRNRQGDRCNCSRRSISAGARCKARGRTSCVFDVCCGSNRVFMRSAAIPASVGRSRSVRTLR